MPRVESETIVTNLLFKALFGHLGQPGSLLGEGRSARFRLKEDLDSGSCQAEGSLEYALPSGKTLSHKNDILITLSGERYVAMPFCRWRAPAWASVKARVDQGSRYHTHEMFLVMLASKSPKVFTGSFDRPIPGK